MARPEIQKCKQYTGDSSQGMRYPLVPLWGSKIEVVAPKCRFRTQILEMCSGEKPFWCWFQEKQHLNGFLPEHSCRAPKFVLHLEHLNGISAEQISQCAGANSGKSAPKWLFARTAPRFVLKIKKCSAPKWRFARTLPFLISGKQHLNGFFARTLFQST